MSTNRIVPSTSAMIGFVYGSQVKITWSFFTSSPSFDHQDRAERHLQTRADRRRSCRSSVLIDDLAFVRRDDLLALAGW